MESPLQEKHKGPFLVKMSHSWHWLVLVLLLFCLPSILSAAERSSWDR